MAKAKLAGDRMPGLFVRTLPSGRKSYLVIARDPNGKQVWQSLGSASSMTKAEARDAARDVVKTIKSGKDRTGPKTFETVSADFMVHHVAHERLRTEKDIRRNLDKHILPKWSGREFTSIKRRDVAVLFRRSSKKRRTCRRRQSAGDPE